MRHDERHSKGPLKFTCDQDGVVEKDINQIAIEKEYEELNDFMQGTAHGMQLTKEATTQTDNKGQKRKDVCSRLYTCTNAQAHKCTTAQFIPVTTG